MNKREKVLKYGIRKFSQGAASVVIGALGFAMLSPVAQADDSTSKALRTITFKYVEESALPSEQKAHLTKDLSQFKVTENQTYYVVYRANQKVVKQTLLATGYEASAAEALAIGGLILVGVSVCMIRSRRKKVITSILLMTAFGTIPLQTFATTDLTGLEKQVVLKVGDSLPDMRLSLDGLTFLGYVPGEVVKVEETSSKEQKEDAKVVSKDGGAGESEKAIESEKKIPEEPKEPAKESEAQPSEGEKETPITPEEPKDTSKEPEAQPSEPEEPVVTPEEPKEPAKEPETQPSEPEEPVVTPEEPKEPAKEPETQPSEPEEPVVTPEEPKEPAKEPETQPSEPEEPVVTPEEPKEPAKEPEAQPSEPEEPVVTPEGPKEPAKEPETQPSEPEEPVVTPEEPKEPAKEPETQPSEPEEPVVTPEEPKEPAKESEPQPSEGEKEEPDVTPEEPKEPLKEPETQPSEPEEPVVTPEEPKEPAKEPETQPSEPEEPVVTPEEPKEPAKEPETQPSEPEEPVVTPEESKDTEKDPEAQPSEGEEETPITPEEPKDAEKEPETQPSEPEEPVVTPEEPKETTPIANPEEMPEVPSAYNKKKIAFQPTDRMSLQKWENGKLTEVAQLDAVPTDYKEYLVKITREAGNDWYLPVKNISQTEGTYQVTADLAEVVQPSENPKEVYTEGLRFMLDGASNRQRRAVPSGVDYTTVADYQEARQTAYRNMAKFIPFYNKEQVVKYGNLVSTADKLYTQAVVSVVPLTNAGANVSSQMTAQDLTQVLIRYADGTVEFADLKVSDKFAGFVQEYQLRENLLYTPEQLLTDTKSVVDAVKEAFTKLDYHAAETYQPLGDGSSVGNAASLMDQLYLEETFKKVQTDIDHQLAQLVANSYVMPTMNEAMRVYLTNELTTQKASILIGLSYLQRWYGIALDKVNLGDLMSFHANEYGQKVTALERIQSLIHHKWFALQPNQHIQTYEKALRDQTGLAFFDFLADQRQNFTTYASEDEWLLKTSQAKIVEHLSGDLIKDRTIPSLYTRLKGLTEEQNGILPLFTARKGVYVIHTPISITYGMYDRYLDKKELEIKQNTHKYTPEQIARIEQLIEVGGKKLSAHFEYWYRILPTFNPYRFHTPTPVYDFGRLPNGKWLETYGAGSNEAMRDFFGVIGSRAPKNHLNIRAYSSGKNVTFFTEPLLGSQGDAVYSHEFVHQNDTRTYLMGNGYRLGQDSESYATGLLQSGSDFGNDFPTFTINQMQELDPESKTRLVNASPDRFQKTADVQEYLHRFFDVIYTLDYVEAQEVLKLDASMKKRWYGQMQFYNDGKLGLGGLDRLADIDLEMAEKLQTWEDLVDNQIITMKGFVAGDTYGKRYVYAKFDNANYSMLSDPDDYRGVGGKTFRRVAFELWAEKGFEEGFLTYASNKLTSEEKMFPRDKQVFAELFKNDEYKTLTEFKKAMFNQRIEKRNQLQETSIYFNGQDRTIRNVADLQKLMAEAVRLDSYTPRASGTRSAVHRLRLAVVNGYLRSTQDFRESIFEDKQP